MSEDVTWAGPDALRPFLVPITDVLQDPENAREHGAEDIAEVRRSLEAYGQRRLAVVNQETGFIEAGNGMQVAALGLDWTHMAVLFVEDDADTATGYSIADNRTGLLAGWDEEKLLVQLAGLRDADVAIVGWSEEELSSMLQGIDPPDFPPGTGNDQHPLDQKKKQTCPKCQHEF